VVTIDAMGCLKENMEREGSARLLRGEERPRLALRRGPRLRQLAIMTCAGAGETYNVGMETEWRNIDLVHRLCEIVAEEIGKPASAYTALICFVADRPGHDQRYAIDCSKLKGDLGWSKAHGFD